MHDTVAIGALAQALGLEAEGDLSLAVRSAAHPAAAGPDDLAVATDAKHQRLLAEGGARAALLDADGDLAALGLSAAIRAPRPRHALAGLTARFAAPPDLPEGVHPTAVVDPTAQLGEGVRVGPFVVIGAGVRIGAGGLIFSHVSIGRDTVVGPDALIHAGARLGHGVTLGARAILHSGCVIGADGFSFVTPEPGAVEAAKSRGASDVAGAAATVHARIHSLGGARLGDDVEVGANAAIDRGTLRDTEVGDGTKIDNLVMVGHNVRIGRDCLLCAHSGVAGSAELGDRVVLGGKAGVADHARIGSDVLLAAASGVSGTVPPRSIMMGTPALKRDDFYRLTVALRRLPRWMERMGGQG